MSTRTYSGTLVLESVFDAIPSSNTSLVSIANQVFSPQVTIVEEDCETLLGKFIDLTFEAEGETEALTGTVMNPAYIQSQLEDGIYIAQVRSAANCVSRGGLCKVCYQASRPEDLTVDVGDRVEFRPEFIIQTELVRILSGDTANLAFDEAEYDFTYVYLNGNLLSSSDYFIDGTVLTILFPPSYPVSLTVKYAVISRVPFFYWLAGTFAGSLLGIQALPIEFLSLKPSLFSSLIPEGEISAIVTRLKSSPLTPIEINEYLDKVPSKMERALLAIATESLFSNVVS